MPEINPQRGRPHIVVVAVAAVVGAIVIGGATMATSAPPPASVTVCVNKYFGTMRTPTANFPCHPTAENTVVIGGGTSGSGPTGPTGPTGETGPEGPAGATGPSGVAAGTVLGGAGQTENSSDATAGDGATFLATWDDGQSATFATVAAVMPRAGTIGNLFVKLIESSFSLNLGDVGEGFIFRVSVNGNTAGTVTCDIVMGTVTTIETGCFDTTTTVAVSAGDSVALYALETGSVGSVTGEEDFINVQWSVTLQ